MRATQKLMRHNRQALLLVFITLNRPLIPTKIAKPRIQKPTVPNIRFFLFDVIALAFRAERNRHADPNLSTLGRRWS
jgi:hypothetical protein